MSLYAFFSDKCFIDPDARTINLEQLTIPGGYLDREMIEYFVEPLELPDVRTDRLEIEYRPSPFQPVSNNVLIEDIMTNIIPAGEAELQQNQDNTVVIVEYSELDYTMFENETLPIGPVRISSNPLALTFDSTKLTEEERTAIDGLSDVELGRISNIMEYVFYGTIPTDTIGEIDVVLDNNAEYVGYVPSSVRLSGLHVAVLIYGGIDIHRYAPQWIEFSFLTNGVTLKFSVWLSRNAFISGYPLFTVQSITPPLPLETLIDPSDLTDPLIAAKLSRNEVDNVLLPSVMTDDQVGMSIETRYIWNNTTHLLSFTVLYRGRPLSPLEIRLAIKAYLLDSGVANEALWAVRLPDIFTRANRFFIPDFSKITTLPTGSIYPSINDLDAMVDRFRHIVGSIEMAVPEDMEILNAAYADFFICGVGSDSDELPRIYDFHPTYTDASTTDLSFQEMTALTQQISLILNNGLAVADGQINTSEYSDIVLYGMNWITIVHDSIAIYILKKTSYISEISTM